MARVFAVFSSGSAADVTLVPRWILFLDPVVRGERDPGVIPVSEVDLGGLGEGGFEFSPPLFVEGAHPGHLFGILRGNIDLLAGVLVDLVEFLPVDEAPLFGHNGGLAPLDGIAHALRVGDEEAVGPVVVVALVEKVSDGHSVKLETGRSLLRVAEIEKGGDDIHKGGEGFDGALSSQLPRGPVEKEGNAVSSVVFAALGATHSGVEDVASHRGAVVSSEDEDGVVGDAQLGEDLAGASHIVVDIGDHSVVGLLGLATVGIHVHVLLRTVERTMRGVGADVGEEGFLFRGAVPDETDSEVEEDIRAESPGGDDPAIVPVAPVKVVVVPEVGGLSHSSPTVTIDFGETTVLRSIGEVVPEVPFSEHAGGVAVVLEELSEGDLVLAQHGSAIDGVPHAGAVGPVAGKQATSGG